MMSFKDLIISELTRLDLMNGRVPFTHHHDYVRCNADQAKYMSRCDVAQLDANDDELYACAFLQAVEGLTTEQKIFADISKPLFYQSQMIASEHLANIDKHLKGGDSK